MPPSSSMEDREANEDVVVVGGKIRSLILLCKQRGVGIASYRTQSFIRCLPKEKEKRKDLHTRYGDLGGRDI